jgi:hypothetical protein
VTKAYRNLKAAIEEHGEPPCSTAIDKTPWHRYYPIETPASTVRKVCEDCPLAVLNACRTWAMDSNFSGVAGGINVRPHLDERTLDIAGDPLETMDVSGVI